MKIAFWLAASAAGLFAAVDGTVINGTTGKPQASVIVTLVQPGPSGMQTLGSMKSDAEGKFKFDKDISGGAALVQAVYQGASYNLVLQPGAPTTGVHVEVYDSSAKAGVAKISQHMILVEPSTGSLEISETFLLENESTTTFQDPAKGSIRFYVPEAATKLKVMVNAPGGLPIERSAEKTGTKNVYKLNYPVKPGQSRFDVSYSLPPSDTFSSKVLHAEGLTRLVTPPAVTIEGPGVEPLGQEPQTKAHIYNAGADYSAKITGFGSLRNQETAAAPAADEDNGEPPVEEKAARVYSKMDWVMGLVFAILGLGGVLLYRRSAA